MVQAAEIMEQYAAAFDRFSKQRSGKEPDWMTQIRKDAFSYFQEIGFPHTRMEEWRHTPIAPWINREYSLRESGDSTIQAADIQDYNSARLDAYRLVFINGWFDAALSDLKKIPEGVRIESIAAVLRSEPARLEPYLARKGSYENRPFAALNTAFMQDGVYLHIPNNTKLEKPVHLFYYSAPGSDYPVSYPRNVIVAGKSSQAIVIESYAGPAGGEYFINAATEVSVGANAIVEHCKIQRESERAFHVTFSQAHLDHDSRYTHHSIALGGSLVRNDLVSLLDGEGIYCTLNGLSMVDGERHVDNHTWIHHARPHCESHELYKNILDDRGTGVFNGRIFVAKDAQKTDAKQTNQSLLLSDEAEINSMPQLEIYADDVKCTHGSTTGHLEEEAIFYLQARGVDRQAARALLTYAFASEIVNQIGVEAIREEMDRFLHAKLSMK